jgi:hypothetical protein
MKPRTKALPKYAEPEDIVDGLSAVADFSDRVPREDWDLKELEAMWAR